MGKQTKSIFLFLSIIILNFTLVGCGGGGGGNDGATPTSSVEKSETYTFENATDSLTIESYRPYEISFQLTKGGLAQAGKAVSMEIFDEKYGTMTSYNIVTDDNGVGTFTYNPPTVNPESNTTISYSYQTDNNETEDVIKTIDLIFSKYTVSTDEKTTTLSLVYMETIAEEGSGKIINRYRVHAVDKKSNQPRVGIPVSMSLINNKKLAQIDDVTGSIKNDNSTIIFEDNKVNFNDASIDIKDEDNLIILPTEERLDASYLGGWTIDKIESNTTLTLFESDINLTKDDKDKLSYVIGNEVRLVGDQVAVADVVNVNNDTTTDENGYIIFDVTFDPKLAGHTVTLEAHGDIDGQRVGVSQIAILRFEDINANDVVISDMYTKASVPVTLTAYIRSVESLSNLELNANSFHTESGSDTAPCSIVSSNYTTDKDGKVILNIKTTELKDENNNHVVTSCTISWNGGINSIKKEY